MGRLKEDQGAEGAESQGGVEPVRDPGRGAEAHLLQGPAEVHPAVRHPHPVPAQPGPAQEAAGESFKQTFGKFLDLKSQALEATFNQEKALVGAFTVIILLYNFKIPEGLFQALLQEYEDLAKAEQYAINLADIKRLVPSTSIQN